MTEGATAQFVRLEQILKDLTPDIEREEFVVDGDSVRDFTLGRGDGVKYKKKFSSEGLEVTVSQDSESDPNNNQVTVTFSYRLPRLTLPYVFGRDGGGIGDLLRATLPDQEHLRYFFRKIDDKVMYPTERTIIDGKIMEVTPLGSKTPAPFNLSGGSGDKETTVNASYTIGFPNGRTTPEFMRLVIGDFIRYVSEYIHTQTKMLGITESKSLPTIPIPGK